MSSQQLVLASSSRYRAQLLQRLQMPFTVSAAAIDESPLEGETPTQLVTRLAEAKATAVANQHRQALIIGSDQVAALDDQILLKPGTVEKAVEQLRLCSGRSVVFYTGLCVLNAASSDLQCDCVPYEVQFRQLTDEQIRRYVDKEQPLDSAGSIKSEGLGITLFKKMHGDDPSALIGLPLIRLSSMLQAYGVVLP